MSKKKDRVFYEKVSPFLKEKMQMLKKQKGEDSEEYQALFLQYKTTNLENIESPEKNLRHYQADLNFESQQNILKGLERLYCPSLVIETTTICAAHCRYCLRKNYEISTLDEDDLINIAKYCGSFPVRTELSEVLITGGDPLIIPRRLSFLIEALIEYAPNIKIIRIATRLPQQSPEKIDNNVYEIFKKYKSEIRFEIATQVNHPIELFPEVINKFNELLNHGVKIYSQNVLLKNVNDNIETLASLYNKMRELNFEAHYLFHCVPIIGIHHLRTSVEKGIKLAKHLTNSGKISGRVKPMYAAMTDVGKVTFYEGVILERNKSNEILLQTSYRYEERLKWNPNWKLPQTAEVDKNGFLRVWYLDGED